MSLSLFCLFLILLQNKPTEQTTEMTMEPTTDNTTSNSRDVETIPTTEPTTDTTVDEASTITMYTQTLSSIEPTTEETTEDSNSNSRNTQTIASIEPTSERTTEETNTNPTISTEPLPIIQTKSLPSDVSDEPENKKLYEQEKISHEKNHSTVNVFGIVLASIVSTVAVFYIAVSLVKKYRRKSYIVRSPGMELGQA